MDLASIFFNGCAFISASFLLHYSSDMFVNNISTLLHRLGIPSILASVLTLGAEWEELAIILASIHLNQPAIGYGNIVGSSIANIVGALSVCLLLGPYHAKFDRNAKVYAKLLLTFTSVFAAIALNHQLDLSGGIILIVAFSVYAFSIASAIYDGILITSSDEENIEHVENGEEAGTRDLPSLLPDLALDKNQAPQLKVTIFSSVAQAHPTETTSLLPTIRLPDQPLSHLEENSTHGILYHYLALLLGFCLLYISAIVLIQTTFSLANSFNLSPQILGLTLLSFTTTIPEKLISSIFHPSSHPDIVISNISTANIFLLTLCIGVLFCSDGSGVRQVRDSANEGGDNLAGAILPIEIWAVWGCSLLLNVVVWIGVHRWIGALMLGCYGAWIGIELTTLKR